MPWEAGSCIHFCRLWQLRVNGSHNFFLQQLWLTESATSRARCDGSMVPWATLWRWVLALVRTSRNPGGAQSNIEGAARSKDLRVIHRLVAWFVQWFLPGVNPLNEAH